MLSEDPPSAASPEAELSALEVAVIDFFVSIVKVVGVPKSVAELYGVLYVSPQPLPLDTLIQRLRMSKGSASQGLKLLRSFGAVRSVYMPGERRDHFTAEVELKRLAAGFIREEIQPRLERGQEKLDHLNRLHDASNESGPDAEFYDERIYRLSTWSRRSREVLPLLGQILE
ncbi:MAG: hypothetical protein V4726_06185 [Verrucomicrobiota bacterium]